MATSNHPVTILCLATEHKGDDFIRQGKREGATVIVITEQQVAHKAWPMESIDERFLVPDLSQRQDVLHGVTYLARTRQIDRIVALDDYDVGTAAALREHMRLPGMGETTARYFRDKLAMREKAAASAIPVPAFTGLFNMAAIRDFTERVPPPWVLKPRFEAGAIGIQRLNSADELWPALDGMGDRLSYYLLEKFLPGNVYHVDALITDREVRFAISSGYGRPPLNVSHEGGVFTTRILPRGGDEDKRLQELLRQMIASTGYVRGVVHTEFIRANEDNEFYFLETGGRVGGANIADLVEQATGLNLWAEWARIEVSHARGEPYELPPTRQDYSGLLVCLARQEHPDMSAYNDTEVVWRLNKEYHAGLIVASADPQRVQALLGDYANRFARDFLNVQPPKEATRTQT
jgi:hypothetical protein